MQTSLGIHNHRSGRAVFRGKNLGPVFDDIRLPKGVKTLPEIFRKAGYWTFNEGGKDDYNFKHNTEEMYDIIPAKKGWGPSALIAGDCWKGRKKNQPFFGQVQLGGGKLGKRAKRIINRNIVPVPPYYPDIPEVREEIAHHYDCLIETDKQVGRIISALKRDDLYESTLIFCFSDHGYKLHRHKQFLYEGGIQMPLIVTGKGVPSKKVRKDLVSGNFIRVSLNVVGIWIVMYVLNNVVIGLIASNVATLVGEDGSVPYLIVNAIFTALGKVFEGVRIIFLLSLFKDLEKS